MTNNAGQFTVATADIDTTPTEVPRDANSTGQVLYNMDITKNPHKAYHYYIHIENNSDVSVDAQPRTTHFLDTDMSAPADDGAALTVAAGESQAVTKETAAQFVDVELTGASAATTGEVVVTFQARA